jgi:hypothetical protein
MREILFYPFSKFIGLNMKVFIKKKFNLLRKTGELISYSPGEQSIPKEDALHNYSQYFLEILEEITEEVKIKRPGRPKKEVL